MSAPTLNPTITTPTLTCTQPAILRQGIQWDTNPDGTQGKIRVVVDVRPYDPVQNKCAPQSSRIIIHDYVALATALAQAGNTKLAAAMQAQLDALGDLIANGIPDDLKNLGTVPAFGEV